MESNYEYSLIFGSILTFVGLVSYMYGFEEELFIPFRVGIGFVIIGLITAFFSLKKVEKQRVINRDKGEE